jgi:hypothetical protein
MSYVGLAKCHLLWSGSAPGSGHRSIGRLESPLERFPAKWIRFASRKRVKITNREPRFDLIETEKALGVTPSDWSLPQRRMILYGLQLAGI